MLPNRIMDPVRNFLISNMVYLGNLKKHSITSHLKCLDCKGPAPLSIYEGRWDERLLQLSLSRKSDGLIFSYSFQFRKTVCCLGNPGKKSPICILHYILLILGTLQRNFKWLDQACC